MNRLGFTYCGSSQSGNNIGICVDMRAANTAVKRVRHNTVKDITLELNNAKVFSKLDLVQAYHQILLGQDCRHITTFSTHCGLYRYCRLNYGTNASAELFQHHLQTTLEGIKRVRNIADDIIIFASDRKQHDKALAQCRLEQNGLTLNFGKCKFLKESLEFFGLIFSKDGTCPDPKKIEAFVNMPTLTSVIEVRLLLGMATYSSQFIPNFATITEPLISLTRKGTHFSWTKEHKNAYRKLKEALTNSPVMSNFDIQWGTMVLVDASPVGISAILARKEKGTNENRIIACASRAFTPVEKRYSQTEREALSLLWGIEYFHLYLFGAPFMLYTDHKPLELIYANPCSKPIARIQSWMLILQQSDFEVVYKKGSDNPADFLSRHPPTKVNFRRNIAEEYVNFVTQSAVLPALSLEEIARETGADPGLRALRAALKTNCWNSDIVKPFCNIKDEITIDYTNDILLRGTRIIVPVSLQKHTIKLAHQGHQGLCKTKSLLREHVWFPGMDKLVKEEIDQCIPCQATRQPNPQN